MATKLYFHATTHLSSGLPTTEQSALTANDNFEADQSVNRLMDTTIGTAQTSLTNASIATATQQFYYCARFVSPKLNQTTIAANTWNYNIAAQQSNILARFPVSSAFLFIQVCCYVWRTSTQTKVGTILEGQSATLSANTSTTVERSAVTTFTGAAQSGLNVNDDVIVFELWFRITQGANTSYTQTFYFDGTTETATHDAVVSNHASFINTPETISFAPLTTAYTRALPTETVDISESLVRQADHPRAMTTETIPVSESLQRTATNNRALATQTTAITEGLQRQYAANRLLATQTTAISETLTKQFTSNRPLAVQTTTIGESLQRVATNNRALATQTTAISETSASQVVNTRALPVQTVPISESLTEIYGAIRALPVQTTAISETSASQVVNTRALPVQTVAISEALSEIYSANRALPVETVPISETRAAVRTLSRLLPVQSVGISEGLIRRYQANRPLPAETIPISESNFIARTLSRALAETVTIAETLNRVFATSRALPVQTVTISESLTSLKTIVRALAAETIVIGEALTKVFNGIRALPPEDVDISETLSETYAATRTLPTQVVTIGETLARVCNVQRLLATQTVTVGEVQSRLYAANRAIPTQTVSISETIAKVFTGNRALPAQTVAIAETLQTNKAFFRAAIETTAISETLARTFTGIRILSPETNSIAESSSRLYNAVRPLAAQTVTINETLARLYAANRILATETVSIAESNVRLLSTFRTRTETIPITESLLRQFVGQRLLATQTTSISDSVAALYTAAPPPGIYERQMPLEIVSITESLNRVVTNSRLIPAQTTAISESLVRAFSTVRLLPTEIVPITESVDRQLVLTRQAGKNVVTFTASSHYLNLGNDATLWSQPKAKFSFSIWVKSDALNTGSYQNIINHNWQAIPGSFILYLANIGYTAAFAVRETAAQKSANVAGSAADVGQWIHYVGTYDNSLGSANIKIYKNKVLGATTGNATETLSQSTSLTIGTSGSTPVGQVKDFRWWNTIALNQPKVNALYDNGPAGPLDPIVNVPDYQLPMNEGQGNPIDIITGTKTAILTNGASWLTVPESVSISESMTKQQALVRQIGKVSMFLDNIDDSITIPNRSAINNLDDYTIAFWLYPTINVAPSTPNIVNKLYPSNNGFILYFTGSSLNLNFRTVGNTGVGVSVSNTTYMTSLGFNRWYHIMITVTRSTGAMKLYLDGVLRNSGTNVDIGANLSGTVANLVINGAASPNKFAGNIRDFRLYRSAQDAAISDIYNNLPTAPTPDFWLKFDEGQGTPLDTMNLIAPVTLTGNPAWALESDVVPITETLARRSTNQRIISEVIPVTESQIRKYSSFRTLPTESVAISESSDRVLASVRSFIENTAISESLERLVEIFRDLADIVPISESLNKALILIRALPAETTGIGDTLARRFTGNRIMPTQTTTIAESLTKLYKGIRTLPTEVVNVTSSVARLLAANRIMPPETMSISEQLKRSFGTKRTLLATVVITESLQRLYAGSRAFIEDVDILESLRILAKLAKVAILAPPALPQRRPETKGATNIRALHPNIDTQDYRTYLKENPPMSERKWSPASTQKRNKVETKNDLDGIDIED